MTQENTKLPLPLPFSWSWDLLPATNSVAKRLPIPISFTTTPLRCECISVDRPPLMCRGGCGSAFNRSCYVNPSKSTWTCAFCRYVNSIPKEYAEGPLEEQINTSYAAVEYAIPTRGNGFEGFCVVFVVDVSVTQRELDAVKQSILEATSELKEKYPLTASVGLITYSRDVTIYDIGGTLKLTKDFGDDDYDSVFPSYLIFDGTKAITVEDAIAILGEKVTFPDGDNNNNNNNNNSNSGELPKFTKNVDTPKLAYMCDVRMCYNAFCALVNAVEAEGDAEPVETRPECAVGTAMTLASALLAVSCTRAMGSRAVLFIGNPCTVGPGAIVGTDRRKSKIRTHADIQSGNAPLLNPALDFYDKLSDKYVEYEQCADLVCCSLDQVGVYEMITMASKTGGAVFQYESFTKEEAQASVRRLFSAGGGESGLFPELNFFGDYEVVLSERLRMRGAFGNVAPVEMEDDVFMSSNVIGMGKTLKWRSACLSPTLSLTFFLDLITSYASERSSSEMVQLIVTYTTAEGHVRKRIITDGCTYSEGAADFDLSLNQRAASVVVARMAAMRCVHDSPKDVFAWVDRTLLRVTKRVAQHVLSSSSSSTATATATDSDLFGEVFSEYPRSMYFLRRSNFLQYFNSTPDETAYWRHHLIGQPAQDAHRMFCPALVAYTVDNPEGTAVPLSMDSVSEHSVLVCDAFFYVALFVGSTFASRSNSNSSNSSCCCDGNGSCDTTQRSAYDEVLCAVVRRAGAYARETLAGGRSPVPACIECSQNSSNSRFLLCLLDPGSSYSSILSPTLAQAQLSSSSSSSPQLSPLLLSPPLQQQQQKKKSSSIFSLYSLITSYYSGSSSSSSSSSSLSFYSPQRQQQGGVLSSIPSEDISLASFLGYLMRAYPNSD